MPETPTTPCPECAGLGRTLDRAVLVVCGECDGEGRVPAVWHHDYIGREVAPGVIVHAPSELLPIPREARAHA